MKKGIALIVILVILIFAGYYITGLTTEKTLKNNIAAVNQTQGLRVELTGYERGFFTSEALLNWTLHIPEQIIPASDHQQTTVIPARDIFLKMPLIIYHGPIIFAGGVKFGFGYAHTYLPLPAELAQKIQANASQDSVQPKPELSFFLNYLNHSQINFSLPAFQLIDKNKRDQSLTWKGMDSKLSVVGKQLKGSIEVEGMQAADGALWSFDSGTLSVTYDLQRANNGLYLGDISISFPSLRVKEASNVLVSVDAFNLTNNVSMEGNLLNYDLNVSLDKMIVHDESYGPLHLAMAIKNLDAEAAGKLNEQAIQLRQAKGEENQRISLAMLSQLPPLLSKGASFEISVFDLTMPKGVVKGKVLVSLPKDPGLNPFILFQRIQGNGSLTIPTGVLHSVLLAVVNKDQTTAAISAETMVDNKIKTMQDSGLIVRQGDDYMIKVHLEKGHLLVNDKPFTEAMTKF